MPSHREQVLQALFVQLQRIPLIKCERNRLRPDRIPPEGLLILRDGDIGEPEVLLSPLSYIWTHMAKIEAYTASGNLDAHMDGLLLSIGLALDENPRLSGLIDLMEISAPDFNEAAPEGGSDVKAALVSIKLIYETAHPLT